jgi:hypothetical protein
LFAFLCRDPFQHQKCNFTVRSAILRKPVAHAGCPDAEKFGQGFLFATLRSGAVDPRQ